MSASAISDMEPAYSTTPIKHYELDGVVHPGYGITWQSSTGACFFIEDISCSYALVNTMARLFTLCGLPPNRLAAVITACLP